MQIITRTIHKNTKGEGDLLDITPDIEHELKTSRLSEGTMTVFVVGSTAAVTTFEYEPGLIQDMEEFYEKIAPRKHAYAHNETWHDGNGFSHVRAAIQGPSLAIPFQQGKLLLGTWQQVVLAEFDIRARQRHVIVQLIGK